ncbi:MAG: DUF1698 domain-containing protein [Deltaproteobacteria bacterium]|nr:DUF1698 domain-containing protein [Deltaproteobacteria bacterium]
MSNQQELKLQMEALGQWFHRIDLGNGLVTPGLESDLTSTKFEVIKPYITENLRNKTVLDIGCNAGAISIEFARQGSRVTGIDIRDMYVNQARWVASVLQLDIRYATVPVYQIDSLGEFDIIVFFGMLYHLRYPMVALDLLKKICKGQLFIETAITNSDQIIMKWANPHPGQRPLDQEADYNWWFPSPNAVMTMLDAAGFKNITLITSNGDRAYFSATAQ